MANFTREWPGQDEYIALAAELTSESDRGAALIAASMVDAALMLAINCRMIKDGDSDLVEKLFYRETAPLSTFAARTLIGYTLGIYGIKTRKALTEIRHIRNAFAHSMRPIKFTLPQISSRCANLPQTGGKFVDANASRERIQYLSCCVSLLITFSNFCNQQEGKVIEVLIE